jgi:hypothetical protein
VRAEERDMQIYRLICESEEGLTAKDILAIYQDHHIIHTSKESPSTKVITESLSRLESYLLIEERNELYTSVTIPEYMLKSQMKHANSHQTYPDIEIVNGVIRVKSVERKQDE